MNISTKNNNIFMIEKKKHYQNITTKTSKLIIPKKSILTTSKLMIAKININASYIHKLILGKNKK